MYDSIVIGAGPAGYELALHLANDGQKVCIVDKSEEQVGGTCLNEGCVPAKNFLETALYAKKSFYFKSCGLDININDFSLSQLQDKTNNLISELKKGIISKLTKQKITIKYGQASFIDKNSINILSNNINEIIKAKNIIIATGSKHKNHPLINLFEDRIISSKEVFTLKELPKSILIIGAGAIGCEFASFFNSFNCEVQVAEFTSKIVPLEDDDVSKTLKRELEKQGIKITVNTNITSYKIHDNNIEVNIDYGKKQEIKYFDKILISIGRVPNTSDLNLQDVNINQNYGFIDVDSNYLAKNSDNIYAIGDVINSPALAHVAYYEAKRLAQIILKKDTFNEKYIFPSVTFCSPQVASIGEKEQNLKEQKINYKIKKIFFKSNAKAKIKGDDSGFIKIIYNIDTNIILGASIIGNEATELIHQFLIIINKSLLLEELDSMIFAHPTLSEAILG